MRLIDADALVKALNEAGTVMGQPHFLCRTVYECINNAPIVDAVPVVRCKECIYYQDNNNGYPHNECRWRTDETPDETDFCSFGEREGE